MAARSSGVVSILFIGILVAACGGSGAPGASVAPGGSSAPAASSESGAPGPSSGGEGGTVPAACTLLTLDQVSALMGEPAAQPEGMINVTGDDESSCDWQQADTTPGKLKLLQLQVFVSTKYLSRTAYSDDETLGDLTIAGASEAFGLNESRGRDVGINMIVGSRRVVVHYSPGGGIEDAPDQYLEALEALAAELAAAVAAS